jgi:hypothetical protein
VRVVFVRDGLGIVTRRCVCTHEHTPQDSQTLLAQSQASRRRAWNALTKIRDLLTVAGVVKIEPVSRPLRFETEGLVLAKGLEQTFRRVELTVNELESAIDGMRPFIQNGETPGFAQAHLRLNRALGSARELLPLLVGRG